VWVCVCVWRILRGNVCVEGSDGRESMLVCVCLDQIGCG